MAAVWHKIPDVDIDGVNDTFTTPDPYIAGSVRLFSPLLAHPDLITELGGSSVQLGIVPLPGDQWFLVYDCA